MRQNVTKQVKYRPKSARNKAQAMRVRQAILLAWEDDMSTFLLLALSTAFLLGMVAGALTRRVVD
jgi:hypothetical protein